MRLAEVKNPELVANLASLLSVTVNRFHCVFQGNVEYEAQDDVHDLAEVKNPELVANLA